MNKNIMGQFNSSLQRTTVKNLVALLDIRRLPDKDILDAIEETTGNRISQSYMHRIKRSIKRDSLKWYQDMRSSQYEYIHEFKARINEITELQRFHNQVINDNSKSTSIKQVSAIELHKLSITLSNLIEVIPTVINNVSATIPATPEDKSTKRQEQPIVISGSGSTETEEWS